MKHKKKITQRQIFHKLRKDNPEYAPEVVILADNRTTAEKIADGLRSKKNG